MSTPSNHDQPPAAAGRKGRATSRPSRRNCRIYERAMFEGETYEAIAAGFAVSRQRVATIVAQVDDWLANQPQHPLARKMRVLCSRRWETLWSRALESFDHSRQSRRTSKERAARRKNGLAAEMPTATVTEQTVREQNGDPRFLHLALRIAQRQDRHWMRGRNEAPAAAEVDKRSHAAQAQPPGLDMPAEAAQGAAGRQFPYLPAALADLALLALGLSNGDSTAVSTQFERRCGEAFACLGFEVRQLGQGCGRVADCLAVAAAERFAVIIDAKVRRRGYTLGTDDRQFCEYALRHTRELALSGIERVYFAVVGHGFRPADLEKLAGLMTGTPIRSVVFIEAVALMRLVHESVVRRREFRLSDIDQLLFGNKIIEQ